MTVRICHKMQSLPLFFLDWGSNNQRDFAVFVTDQICGIENVTYMILLPLQHKMLENIIKFCPSDTEFYCH